jgi:hypothetical protein
VFQSWTDNRELLLPMVESGQIQLGNHTWLHHDLTKMTGSQIADELRHTDQFIKDTFGADATPYYRPPYGAYNDLVTNVAADLGYTVTTMWNGNIGDDAILAPQDIVANADKYYVAQNVVIGHLNHPAVTGIYHQLLDIIATRGLRTVTLNDVFDKPEATRLISAYPTLAHTITWCRISPRSNEGSAPSTPSPSGSARWWALASSSSLAPRPQRPGRAYLPGWPWRRSSPTAAPRHRHASRRSTRSPAAPTCTDGNGSGRSGATPPAGASWSARPHRARRWR